MKTICSKMQPELDGDFVVFLIRARINKVWKIHKWLPVFVAMPHMLKELSRNPDCGLLAYQAFPGIIVQYWRSFDHLEAYARGNHAHRSAWAKFYKRIGVKGGDVGVWHETYLVGPGGYEAIYDNMPTFGLGAAGRLLPVAEGHISARLRLEGKAQESRAISPER